MHDVLAHRLSLISLQAGALEVPHRRLAAESAARPPARSGTGPTRPCSDLRTVFGVLRDGTGSWPAPPTHRVRPAVAGRPRPRQRADGRLHQQRARRRPGGDGRPHAVPDRAGGLDQRPQTRAGRRGADRVDGVAGGELDIRLRNPLGIGPTRTRARAWDSSVCGTRRPPGGRVEHGVGQGQRSSCTAWIPWAA